jgi:hypothetical protein
MNPPALRSNDVLGLAQRLFDGVDYVAPSSAPGVEFASALAIR